MNTNNDIGNLLNACLAANLSNELKFMERRLAAYPVELREADELRRCITRTCEELTEHENNALAPKEETP